MKAHALVRNQAVLTQPCTPSHTLSSPSRAVSFVQLTDPSGRTYLHAGWSIYRFYSDLAALLGGGGGACGGTRNFHSNTRLHALALALLALQHRFACATT